MLSIIMKNINVKHAYRKIIENSQVTIEKDLLKDLLEKLISLYLEIRCHSFAKDVQEKQKMIAKINSAKSLVVSNSSLQSLKPWPGLIA